MTWVDLSGAFGYGTILTSTQMQNLRDNITALADGDSGAPMIDRLQMNERGTLSSNDTSWEDVYQIRIPVPANIGTIKAYFELRSDNASGTAYARIRLTDDEASDFDSDTASQTGTTWTEKSVTIDASSASDGTGYLIVQLYTSNALYDAELMNLTVFFE